MKYRAWIESDNGLADEYIGDWDEVVDFLIERTYECCADHPAIVVGNNAQSVVDAVGAQVEELVDKCGFGVEVGVEVVA